LAAVVVGAVVVMVAVVASAIAGVRGHPAAQHDGGDGDGGGATAVQTCSRSSETTAGSQSA
jgi:hypothetical protein